ncbi:MAG: ZIP family metal transporter [Clostridia bacterium]|nr:ZIP family metal transporter [Clostridia bacterium]
MKLVLLTALGVGGATAFGAVLGFIFKKFSHKFEDIITGFAAGVMLAAALMGLIIPALEDGGILKTVVGIFLGAVFLNLMDAFIPHSHQSVGQDLGNKATEKRKSDKVMLFVLAIAIHNFPEGIAAGVGFGTGEIGKALTVAGGIALQNIPEGMIIIGPMLLAGMGKTKTFLIALATGLVEVVGTFVGYFAVNLSTAILPIALAFAGGTMLYIISDEMIPETHAHGNERGATYALLAGFCLMLFVDFYLG